MLELTKFQSFNFTNFYTLYNLAICHFIYHILLDFFFHVVILQKPKTLPRPKSDSVIAPSIVSNRVCGDDDDDAGNHVHVQERGETPRRHKDSSGGEQGRLP